MSQLLYRLGRFAARRPWAVIASWLVVSVVVIGASGTFGRELEDSFAGAGGRFPQGDGAAERRRVRPGRAHRAGGPDAARRTARRSSTLREARAALGTVQAEVGELPNVLRTSDPVAALAAGREAAVASRSVSPDGRVALIRVHYPVLEELEAGDLENLKAFGAQAGAGSPLRVEMGGDLFFAFEEPETGTRELIGLLAAAVVLFVAFGSLIAMGLPIGMALFGLALGISSMSLVTYLIEIPSWAPQLAVMVGLGVGIDYALFLVTRHREQLARGMTIDESIGRAVATAGQVVVFAGGTVVIAILGLAVAGIPFVTAAGVAIAIVVLIMVLASVTLLPAFLGLAGTWINRLGPRRSAAREGAAAGSGWRRWGDHVARHARAYTIGVTLLLLALAAPVVALKMGNPDEGSLPETRTERRAYDLVAAGFGPGSNGPLIVAVDVSKDASIVEPLRRAISADTGIDAVAAPEVSAAAGVATLTAYPATGPQDAATRDTLSRLRSDVLPPVLAESPARAHIGGQTATFADVSDRVKDRLPLFIAAVILLSFLLLVVVFRSVVVPLKAALMNLLSIGAAYGVLVMVFQWGWGADLIGLESTIPIISFIPMFMFAILFGLSMDYEVFLLSRVREEYLRTGDTATSVINGIAATARVITLGGTDHDLRLPGLRPQRRPDDEDVRPRARDGDLHRRDDRATGARAGRDDAARRAQLVAAALASVAA